MITAILNKILGRNSESTFGKESEANRDKWLEKTLKKIPAGSRVLDAGAGEQKYKKFCGHLHYVSQDFGQYKPNVEKAGVHEEKWDYGKLYIVSDIASIPEPDKSFDAIFCKDVFEHIINPREAVTEFSRLLKTGGHLIITAPFSSITHFAPYHFYSGFNKYFFEKSLADNKFEILEISANDSVFDFLAQELNRLPHVNSTYSDYPVNKWDGFILAEMIRLLERMALKERDKSSSELLNHGWFVFARKL